MNVCLCVCMVSGYNATLTKPKQFPKDDYIWC